MPPVRALPRSRTPSRPPRWATSLDRPDYGLDEVTVLPTITSPDKILCVGLNYREH